MRAPRRRTFPARILCGASIAVLSATPLALVAQASPGADAPKPPVVFGDRGIVFNGADGFTYLALRFRVQEWAVFSSDDSDPQIERTHLAVRRARFRFESVVWDPRLKVNVQFSFSRGDQDFENSNFPNVLRDANFTWQATPRLAITAGQGKLPGNRQRVTSSGELQFPDRSIVNAAFTLDRDVGVVATYAVMSGGVPFTLFAAVTGGEGRNASSGDAGLAYTGRIELKPLGVFGAGGDYFEGDLIREMDPKLSVGIGYSHNERAMRTGGQLGKPLFEPRTMTTALADVLFKYRGFAASAELARRQAPDPFTTDGTDTRYILVGDGLSVQASYLTRRNLEPAIRVSIVQPHRDLSGLSGADRQRQTSFGLTRYLKGHRVKFQNELMRDDFYNSFNQARRQSWSLRSSFEVGI